MPSSLVGDANREEGGLRDLIDGSARGGAVFPRDLPTNASKRSERGRGIWMHASLMGLMERAVTSSSDSLSAFLGLCPDDTGAVGL